MVIYIFVAICFDFQTDGGEEFCCWTEQQASTRIGEWVFAYYANSEYTWECFFYFNCRIYIQIFDRQICGIHVVHFSTNI
jgi:hypothetical protein